MRGNVPLPLPRVHMSTTPKASSPYGCLANQLPCMDTAEIQAKYQGYGRVIEHRYIPHFTRITHGAGVQRLYEAAWLELRGTESISHGVARRSPLYLWCPFFSPFLLSSAAFLKFDTKSGTGVVSVHLSPFLVVITTSALRPRKRLPRPMMPD